MNKIVFFIGSLGGGGAERVTIQLADYFCNKGCKVYFLAFSKENSNYIVNKNVMVTYLPVSENKIVDVIEKIKFIKKYLLGISPDYVVSLGLGHQYIFLSNTIGKYKYILSERNSPIDFYKHWYEKFFNKYCYERAYKVVFQTTNAQQYYNKKIQEKSKIIFNPINPNILEGYDGLREKRIVFVGRLSPQKNVYLLLDAFRKFHKKYGEYVLDIYGQGELEKELIAYCEECKISGWVRFNGLVSDIYEKMVKATMYISSSDYEGMSNSMLEALAMGIPSICTDCPIGGARMVIQNNENGILVPIKNTEKMTEAMLKIVEDEQFAKKLSKNSRKLREYLNVQYIGKQWEGLMKKQ